MKLQKVEYVKFTQHAAFCNDDAPIDPSIDLQKVYSNDTYWRVSVYDASTTGKI